MWSTAWSPNGKRLASASRDRTSKVFDLEKKESLVTFPAHAQPVYTVAFAPDGSKVVIGGNWGSPAATIRILDMATHKISDVPGSKGLFSPRWSPDGRYLAAMNSAGTRLLLFDFQTQKWTELAKGSTGWPTFSKDGQYLYFYDVSGTGALLRVRISDHQIERAVDLKNFVMTGAYGSWFSLAPDGSPIALRDAGTSDVYSLDWEEP